MDAPSAANSATSIMVFRPTMEEFSDFPKYIEKMESVGAHKAGLAKIIPPEGWCPRKGGYGDIDDLKIDAVAKQHVIGSRGHYTLRNVLQKTRTVSEFRKLAESNRYTAPDHSGYDDLEKKFWKYINYSPSIYAVDGPRSLFDKNVKEFNTQRLNTILDDLKNDYGTEIEGVNTAYLYFGMWKTTFPWHTEDMDLYSLNYLHFGAPKSWYVVPPEHGRRLETYARRLDNSECPGFLRHKSTILSPNRLEEHSIPFHQITQEAGQFIVTFPYAYHAGFNHGFNCAEATNFASLRWLEYAKHATQCVCYRTLPVTINLIPFVRKYQPEIYEVWETGEECGYHPEDRERRGGGRFLGPTSAEKRENAEKEKELSKLRLAERLRLVKRKLFCNEENSNSSSPIPDDRSENVEEGARCSGPALTKRIKH